MNNNSNECTSSEEKYSELENNITMLQNELEQQHREIKNLNKSII